MESQRSDAGPEAAQALNQQARLLRDLGVLGKGGMLLRLFDYLVVCAESGKVPKEAEIAVEAFGRGADFDASQDATVRVYAHKLRRALEDHYQQAGAQQPWHLGLPKGEYRLTLMAQAPFPAPANEAPTSAPSESGYVDEAGAEPASVHAPAPEGPARSRRQLVLGAALTASLGVNAAFGVAWWRQRPTPAEEELSQLRASPLWAPLLADERPVLVATGDYMLLGDTGGGVPVQRLVREFEINSREDLARFEASHASRTGHYLDLGLSYLPVSVGSALRDVLPLLAMPHKRIRVLPASQLGGDSLGLAHLVYVGLVSGMGRLRSLVFAGSGFATGPTYDELVDTASGQRFTASGPELRQTTVRDYSLLAAFGGPGGQRVVVVSGTRDLGLVQSGQIVGRAHHLHALGTSVGGAGAFEALYAAEPPNPAPVPPRQLLARPLQAGRTWPRP